MKISQIKRNMLVVLNDRTDAQVYRVNKIEGFATHLVYDEKSGGQWMDVCYLKILTPEQLKKHENIIDHNRL